MYEYGSYLVPAYSLNRKLTILFLSSLELDALYLSPAFSWMGSSLTLKRWSKRQKLTQTCENLLFYTREGEKWPNILESNVDFSPSDIDFFVWYQNTLRNSSPCVFSSYYWNSPTKQEQDVLKIQSAKQEETLWNLKCSTIRHLCWA